MSSRAHASESFSLTAASRRSLWESLTGAIQGEVHEYEYSAFQGIDIYRDRTSCLNISPRERASIATNDRVVRATRRSQNWELRRTRTATDET